MAAVQFPCITVSDLISLLQAAQAEGYGAFPVLLGPPDGELRPVTIVEHIVSEGVLLRALTPEQAAHHPGYEAAAALDASLRHLGSEVKQSEPVRHCSYHQHYRADCEDCNILE